MKAQRSKTVGQYSHEFQQKPDEKINAIDLQRAIFKGDKPENSLENRVKKAVEDGIAKFEGNFFLVLLLRKERLMPNVIRPMLICQQTCPTPTYDQTVWSYNRSEEKLEQVWVVPDKQTVPFLILMKKYLPSDQEKLVEFAEIFVSGELDRFCQRLNCQATRA